MKRVMVALSALVLAAVVWAENTAPPTAPAAPAAAAANAAPGPWWQSPEAAALRQQAIAATMKLRALEAAGSADPSAIEAQRAEAARLQAQLCQRVAGERPCGGSGVCPMGGPGRGPCGGNPGACPYGGPGNGPCGGAGCPQGMGQGMGPGPRAGQGQGMGQGNGPGPRAGQGQGRGQGQCNGQGGGQGRGRGQGRRGNSN